MSLYVALDSRVENVPLWLSDFTLMRSLFTATNELNFNIYCKNMKAGEKITLGSNGQASYCVNYSLLAVPSAPEKTAGDVNSDGKLDLPDLVLTQKFILRNTSFTAEQRSRTAIEHD